MQIRDRVFLVTGGALGPRCSDGVEHLTGEGARVVIADQAEGAGQALASSVGGAFIRTDVTSDSDAEACVEGAVERFGAVHGIVNGAGVADGERVIGINRVGTFNMIRLAAARMAANEPGQDSERGVIVATASVAAL